MGKGGGRGVVGAGVVFRFSASDVSTRDWPRKRASDARLCLESTRDQLGVSLR